MPQQIEANGISNPCLRGKACRTHRAHEMQTASTRYVSHDLLGNPSPLRSSHKELAGWSFSTQGGISHLLAYGICSMRSATPFSESHARHTPHTRRSFGVCLLLFIRTLSTATRRCCRCTEAPTSPAGGATEQIHTHIKFIQE